MGPLEGIKIVELAGIGPGPMAAMLLADLGATVLWIERRDAVELGVQRPLQFDLLLPEPAGHRTESEAGGRQRACSAADRKRRRPDRRLPARRRRADGARAGSVPRTQSPARLRTHNGVGPNRPARARRRIRSELHRADWHPRQIGRHGQPPTIPLNLVGDFGGGGLYLALGMLAGILEARQSGHRQVVDAAIVDGAASLAASTIGMHAAGMLQPERGTNMLDSGAYFYDVYACADGKWISVATRQGDPAFSAYRRQRSCGPRHFVRRPALHAGRCRDGICRWTRRR